MLDHLDAPAARRWGLTALRRLGEQRAEIDEQNVFPVPDGDTGTNLYLTVEAAVAEVDQVPDDAPLPAVAEAFARGALLGARGNSGVILSQLLRGWADALGEHARADADAVRDAMDRAAEQAYAAVARPVEGTMLTVVREAARQARAVPAGSLTEVLDVVAKAARQATERTPEQLDVLARSGVVDAGAQGLVVLLDALADVGSGRQVVPRPPRAARSRRFAPGSAELAGPAFEVMYLLDAPDAATPALRETLTGLGDAVVVVGGAGLWNVHVHTDEVGPAIEAGIAVGRPHRVRVTDLVRRTGAVRHAPHLHTLGEGRSPEDAESAADASGSRSRWDVRDVRDAHDAGPVAVVAGAAGPGLARLFTDCAAHVLPIGPGRRPGTPELLEAVRATGSASVVLLPNDPDTLVAGHAAAAAARDEGVRVTVLPTRAAVQGLAAIAVHDPHALPAQDLVRMAAAAAATRHGAVTVATREALTSAGWCRPGDGLGVVDGDVVVVDTDLVAVAHAVTARLLAAGGELLTVVTGADPSAEALAQAVADEVRATRRDVELSVVDGGQQGYPLLLGLE